MRKLTSNLLLRLTAITLTFAVALTVTFAWQLLSVFSSPPDSSQRLIGVLTPAVIRERMWPAGLVEKDGHFWIFRRGESASDFDVNRPVALPHPDTNLIHTGCLTLAVAVDETRKLKLNTEAIGSLDDPSGLSLKLTGFFRERELYRAYRPGMEYRAELPSHERIEKTILILPSSSLRYGEVLELLSIIEQTGACPIVLQAGDLAQVLRQSAGNYSL